jgi:hypothetical protein
MPEAIQRTTPFGHRVAIKVLPAKPIEAGRAQWLHRRSSGDARSR